MFRYVYCDIYDQERDKDQCINCDSDKMKNLQEFGECQHAWIKYNDVKDYITLHQGISNDICEICKKETNSLSGDPTKWPIKLPYPGGNGKLRTYHMGCIVDIINKNNEIWEYCDMNQKLLYEELGEVYSDYIAGKIVAMRGVQYYINKECTKIKERIEEIK